ncbi:hypothetical protein RND81_11G138100 [Saponaria officinalis]
MKPVAARAKSPSIITKGTKNFMSPTISAASKINPSPRKKVLGERNEAIRTSASLSDGKFHFFSTSSLDFDYKTESNPEMSFVKAENEVHYSDSKPEKSEKAENEVHYSGSKLEKSECQEQNGFGSSLGEVTFEPDLVVMSPEVPLNTSKSSESLPLSKMPKTETDHNGGLDIEKAIYSSPCIVASFDTDPSLPPYDPKNNYLSPRPAFLHYNPNRRIESLVNQGTKLEDDFTSESVSEIEYSSEEVQSEDSLNDEEDVASSHEISSEIDLTESRGIEETVEVKMEPRSRKFTSWKTVAVTLLFVLGFMSMSLTFYPGIGNAVFGDETISHIYSQTDAVALLAKENLNLVVENAKLLSAYSVDYFSQTMQRVRGGVDRFSLEFVNLTAWQEPEDFSYVVEKFQLEPYFEKIKYDEAFTEMQEYYEFEDQAFSQMQIYVEPKDETVMDEESGLEEEEDSVTEVESFTQLQNFQTPMDEQTSVEEAELMRAGDSEPEEVEENPVVEKASSVDEPNDVEVEVEVKVEENPVVEKASSVDEPNDVEVEVSVEEIPVVEKASSVDEPNDVDVEGAVEFEDQFILSSEIPPQEADTVNTKTTQQPHVSEVEPQIMTANELPENDDNVKTEMTELDSDTFLLKATDGNSQLQEASEKISTSVAAAVALVVVSLVAAYFMYTKPRKSTPFTDTVIPEMKNNKSAENEMENVLVRETSSSWTGQVEVDMIGNSCPTEMSSFENSTSVETTQMGGDEAQSLQKDSKRNYKRESLVSSSSEHTMDSAYGSFTTYSVIHPKHRDEEVVTPVRRSSRIRSKVTSP